MFELAFKKRAQERNYPPKTIMATWFIKVFQIPNWNTAQNIKFCSSLCLLSRYCLLTKVKNKLVPRSTELMFISNFATRCCTTNLTIPCSLYCWWCCLTLALSYPNLLRYSPESCLLFKIHCSGLRLIVSVLLFWWSAIIW